VPYAKGISNHMGSKATKNRKLMKSIMEELKRRRLYFLDSVASSKTVCADEAKKAGVKCIGRDVFLDNILTKKDISAQIDLLIETARENGSAVGIGHDRPLTLNVIKERLDNLKDNDIKFVLVSELLKKT
jgi:polysaccharide deacetylase 2 family uncharacterized protein YibQ